MTRYAESTSVTAEKSRSEIEATLRRYEASAFAYGWQETQAVIQFQMSDRHVRFELDLPDRRATEFTHTRARGTERSAAQAEAAWEQACRQRWRALALVIKAKLEAVEAGISTVESEFLAHTVLPDGQLVKDWLGPQIDKAYAAGTMPSMLAIGPST